MSRRTCGQKSVVKATMQRVGGTRKALQRRLVCQHV